jgi:mRNA-degrading endonuclease RelE of RelBE toxin-antitoxin system
MLFSSSHVEAFLIEKLYGIEWTTRAAKEFLKLPRQVQERLQGPIDRLAILPRPIGCKNPEDAKDA